MDGDEEALHDELGGDAGKTQRDERDAGKIRTSGVAGPQGTGTRESVLGSRQDAVEGAASRPHRSGGTLGDSPGEPRCDLGDTLAHPGSVDKSLTLRHWVRKVPSSSKQARASCLGHCSVLRNGQLILTNLIKVNPNQG